MVEQSPYAALFEPIQIGPKIAKNRFYQAPHCNGMGRNFPSSMARMRGIKAEGGWAVVCTEQCDYHWTSDSVREIRLWDDRDIPYLARMVEAVHEHDALASVQLVHMGYYGRNLYSREPAMAPSARPPGTDFPGFARAMNKRDIRNVRRWHRDAALRAKRAGYDIVMVYAGHDISLPLHFLSRRHNQRNDEYGGSLENRARLLRELIEETKDAVGDSCAVSVRLAVDELMGDSGIAAGKEGREVIEMLAELPDLWDVNCSDWGNDSISARFSDEGFQEPYIAFVKQCTSKPVVGVGRYTSPERMLSLINKGVLDMIGAARPSIADPFLPKKIEENRPEDIRECIGCNICVAYSNNSVPIRCTQNPTMGEEWRRDWHPENFSARNSDDRFLIIGAGAAGLEAAHVLGKRGYEVILVEQTDQLGGRISRESSLPGLQTWSRVSEYRKTQIASLSNVEIYLQNRLSVDEVLETGCSRIAIATGANWRRDGVGRGTQAAIAGSDTAQVFSPDDVINGVDIPGPVLVYDDDHYYMGGVVAEALKKRGLEVILVTPAAVVSSWTEYSLEQGRIQSRLHHLGVEIIALHNLTEIQPDSATLAYVYTGETRRIDIASVVLVTSLCPNDAFYHALVKREDEWAEYGVDDVARIGDCYAPGTIAQAVWLGHKYARTLTESDYEYNKVPFDREIIELANRTRGELP